MPNANKKGCKNGKQINLLVQGTRSNSRYKTLSKQQIMFHTSE